MKHRKAEKHLTVNQVSRIAGVSIKALHHYDATGLLPPSGRSEAGYRLYNRQDLYRLQQILFYRELDFPLKEIKRILDAPGFDLLTALKSHRKELMTRSKQVKELISTIDRTIKRIKGEEKMVTDRDLYKGFSKEKKERYDKEARALYGNEKVDAVNKRIKGMSKSQWENVQTEAEEINKDLLPLMDHDPQDADVQAIIERHHRWIENFYPAPKEVYEGLADLYTSNPEFRMFFDKHRTGLADFLAEGMRSYFRGRG